MTENNSTLYITGAGVSAESGIPTFRGNDGYWTIGSKNYTPQTMATRAMYLNEPLEFLQWYYHRFAQYRNCQPNAVHYWLADKNLLTQNIDGLDGKAGNKNYLPIHGRIDQMHLFHSQEQISELLATPWENISSGNIIESLMLIFRIKDKPQENYSYKPFVLLFDEYYSEQYRFSEAKQRIEKAYEIVFIGTSFSVGITDIALNIAHDMGKKITVVDPHPLPANFPRAKHFKMLASEYIHNLNKP